MKYSEAWNEMHKIRRLPAYYDPTFQNKDEDNFIGVVKCAWCGKEIIAVWDKERLARYPTKCTYPFYPRPYLGLSSEKKGKIVPYAHSDLLKAIKKKCNLAEVLVNVLFRVRNSDSTVATDFLENPYDVELLCGKCLLKTTWQDQAVKVTKLRNTYYRVILTSPTKTKEEVLADLGLEGRKTFKSD